MSGWGWGQSAVYLFVMSMIYQPFVFFKERFDFERNKNFEPPMRVKE
jgi:hypothetical protein